MTLRWGKDGLTFGLVSEPCDLMDQKTHRALLRLSLLDLNSIKLSYSISLFAT